MSGPDPSEARISAAEAEMHELLTALEAVPRDQRENGMIAARTALNRIRSLKGPPLPWALKAGFGSEFCRLAAEDPDLRQAGLSLLREGLTAAQGAGADPLPTAHMKLALAQELSAGPEEELAEALRWLAELRSACSPEHLPELFAAASYLLGFIHRSRLQGEAVASNAEAARYYEDALRVYTQREHPEEWARTSNNLGMAYLTLATSGVGPGFDSAVARFHDALEVHTEQADPRSWRMTHRNVARLYATRQDGSVAENRERVIEHGSKALRGFQPADNPESWYWLHSVLAEAYARREGPDPIGNLARAAQHDEAAMVVLDPGLSPQLWAKHAFSAGSIWVRLAKVVQQREQVLARGIELLTLVIEKVPDALQEHQMSREMLAGHFMSLPGPDRVENIDTAINHLEMLLQIGNLRETEPARWARAHHNLGELIGMSDRGSFEENRTRTIQHLRFALEVFTRAEHPRDWALAKSALGAALVSERAKATSQDLEDGIASMREALAVRTRTADGRGWGRLNVNLAAAYLSREKGEPAGNLVEASQCLKSAAEVLSPGETPDLWCMLQFTRSRAAERAAGEDPAGLQKAAELIEDALQADTGFLAERFRVQLHRHAASIYEAVQEKSGETAPRLAAVRHLRACVQIDRLEGGDKERSMDRVRLASLLYKLGSHPPLEVPQGSTAHCGFFDEGIAALELAIEYLPADMTEPERALFLQMLGNLHYDHPSGHVRHRKRARTLYEQALRIEGLKQKPAAWADACANLAEAAEWSLGYETTVDGALRDLALLEDALSKPPTGLAPLDLARVQIAVGNVLRFAGEREGSDLVRRSIQLCRAALRLLGPGGDKGTRRRAILQIGRSYRILASGNRPMNVESALACFTVLERSDPEVDAALQQDLATAYVERVRGDRRQNIEKALRLALAAEQYEALHGTAEDRASALEQLAIIYGRRIEGDPSDNQERAISFYLRAIELLPGETYRLERARVQHNAAGAYLTRIAGRHWENIEKAIEHLTSALAARRKQEAPDYWAMTSANLGVAFGSRVLGDPRENALAAIGHLEAAATIRTPEASPQGWAELQFGLGNAWRALADLGEAGARDLAIAHYESVSAATENIFPGLWARALLSLARLAEAPPEREAAIAQLERVLKTLGDGMEPELARLMFQRLGELHLHKDQWQDALGCYDAAINVGKSTMRETFTQSGRQSEAGNTSGLYASSALCLLRLNRWDAAFERLDEGKARLLTEELGAGAHLTEGLDPALRAQFDDAHTKWRQLARELSSDLSPGPQRDETARSLREVRRQLAEATDRIRSVRPDFMGAPLSITELLRRCPAGGALVAPLVSHAGGVVFVVPEGVRSIERSHIVELPEFNTSKQRRLLMGTQEHPGWFQGYFDMRDGKRERWRQTAEDVLRRIWDELIGPVHDRLQELGVEAGASLLLLPQGGLGVLPLHAAWREVDGQRRYLLDDYTVRSIPALRALPMVQRKSDPGRHQFLIVPDPSGTLPFAAGEVRLLSRLAGADARVVAADAATPQAVVEAASEARQIHFACHAFYDWDFPLRSGLVLASGAVLSAQSLARSQVDLGNCALVTLAACESGLADVQQAPDEYIGLSASFLQAGAAAVVASLWPVSDLSSMLLMEQFHTHLRRGRSAAEALRSAQLGLRGLTAGELRRKVERTRRMSDDQRPLTLDQVNHLLHWLQQLPPGECPYRSLVDWAAFAIAGQDVKM